MQVYKYWIILFLFLGLVIPAFSQNSITIGLVKYPAGDDWYDCRNALSNFLSETRQRTDLNINEDFPIVELDKDNIYQYPILLLNGHGRINLNNEAVNRLREYLMSGGFLIVNDDYGLEPAFRELAEDLFPDQDLILLPNDHSLYSIHYDFPQGCPKIHIHDGEPARCFALFYQQRMVVLYIYNSDIVDGWEVEEVHHDPEELRDAAIHFGINMLYYILSQ